MGASWKDSFIRYLRNNELPSDIIEARAIQEQSKRYQLFGRELFQVIPRGPMLKCIDTKKVLEVMQRLHSGDCGNHLGGKSGAHIVSQE